MDYCNRTVLSHREPLVKLGYRMDLSPTDVVAVNIAGAHGRYVRESFGERAVHQA
jgi:hypothetical protein